MDHKLLWKLGKAALSVLMNFIVMYESIRRRRR
jgi:hypothetical protein